MSKLSIGDFFEADFDSLIPNKMITFDVFLYFKANDHVLKWRERGGELSADFLERYHNRGIQSVWILNQDRPLYEEYCSQSDEIPFPDEVDTPSEYTTEENTEPKDDSPEEAASKIISDVMKSPDISLEEKQKIVSAAAQELLSQAGTAETVAEQQEENRKAQEIVKELLTHGADPDESPAANLMEESHRADENLDHAMNVATYAVLFSMAFGKVDPSLIEDIALAGLLHDFGISQLPLSITQTPVRSLSQAQTLSYSNHVNATLELISKISPSINVRVITLIRQSHEKFDGTGYPHGIQGFKLDDLSQILALAELVGTLVSGSWDGTERTVRSAFSIIEELEKRKSFPQFFNPEVLTQIKKWVHSAKSKKAEKDAFENASRVSHEVLDRKSA